MRQRIILTVVASSLLVPAIGWSAAPQQAQESKKAARKSPTRGDAKAEQKAKSKNAIADANGRKVYVQSGCQACHSVRSKGLAKTTPKVVTGGPDLSTVGKRWKEQELRAWLNRELVRNGKKHPLKFSGGEQRLSVLVKWLATLK